MATNNTQCIREEMASLVSFLRSPINPDRATLVRRFSITDPNEASTALEDLRLRQSVNNTDGEECHYVDDPMAGQVVYEGRYRGVALKVNSSSGVYNSIFIDQTLARGLITAFEPSLCFVEGQDVYNGNDVGELQENTKSDDPERYVRMLLDGVDPDHINEIIDGVRSYGWTEESQAMTSINGVALLGAYHLLSIKTKKNDDETQLIEIIIARPQFTVRGFQDYGTSEQSDMTYLYNVPKDLVQDVVDSLKLGTNKSTRIDYRTGSGVADITFYNTHNDDLTASLDDNHSDQHLETKLSIEDTEYHSAAIAPLADVPFTEQGTITETKNYPNKDGTFKTENKVTESKEVLINEFESEVSAARVVSETTILNLRDGDELSIVEEQGHIKSRDRRINVDGTYNESVKDAESIDQTATVGDAHDGMSDTKFTSERSVVHTAAKSPESDIEFDEPGTISTVRNDPNPDGTFKTTVISNESKEVIEEPVNTMVTAFKDIDVVTGRNIRPDNLDPTFTQDADIGEVQTIRIEAQPDGTFTGEKQKDVSIEVIGADKSGSIDAFSSVEGSTDRNVRSPDEIPTEQDPGTIKEMVVSLNEYGVSDVKQSVRRAIEVDDATLASSANAFEKYDSVQSRNVQAKLSDVTTQAEAGKVVTHRSELNEYGLWNTAEETREAIEVEDAVVETQFKKFSTDSRIEDKNLSAAPTEPDEFEVGHIKTLRVEKNQYGLTDSAVLDSEGHTVANAEITIQVGAIESSESHTDRNVQPGDVGTVPTAETGKIVTKRDVINEYGLHDVSVETRTATEDLDGSEHSIEIDAFKKTEATTDRNKNEGDLEDMPTTQEDGIIKSVAQSLNAFGLFDQKVVEATATARPEATVETSKNKFMDSTRTVDRNSADPVDEVGAFEDGTIEQRSSSLNEFKLYDNVTDVKTANTAETESFISEKTPQYTATEISFRNRETIPELGENEYGTVNAVLNEFGRYDGNITTRDYSDAVVGYFPASGLTEQHVETRTKADGTEQRRLVIRTYNISYFALPTDAHTWMSGGLDGSSSQNLGAYLILAKKVTDITYAAWTTMSSFPYVISWE